MKTSVVTEHFGTHFVWEGKKAHVFYIDTCEKCGCEAEAANAIGLVHPREELKNWGLKELSTRLPELGYCESLEMVVCPDCYETTLAPKP